MKTEQRTWTQAQGWQTADEPRVNGSAQLVLAFGATAALRDPSRIDELHAAYPRARVVGCSTAGEISRQGVEQTGGAIRVRDRPGKGCVFTVDLPRMR